MDLREIEAIYPLSPIQMTVMRKVIKGENREKFCSYLSCALKGELDYPAFESACRQMTDRHPLLRTSFVWKMTETPLQVVHKFVKTAIERLDWRGQTVDQQNEKMRAMVDEIEANGLDPFQPPLMRLLLCHTDETVHQLIWTYHRLLFDDQSLYLLLQEILETYDGVSRKEAPVSKPAAAFQDYIAGLKGQDLEQGKDFWKGILAGLGSTTLPEVNKFNGKAGLESSDCRHVAQLSAKLTGGLQHTAQERQADVHSLVLAAWAILLNRYTESEEVNFAVTVSTRPIDVYEAERILGPFSNTLPVRITFAPNTMALTILKEVEEYQVNLRRHGYIPIEIDEESEGKNGWEAFATGLVLDGPPVGDLCLEGTKLEIGNIRFSRELSLPLSIKIDLNNKRPALQIDYDYNRYDNGIIARIVGHLETLLESIVSDPNQRVTDLRILKESERRQIIESWNDTVTSYSGEQCIHKQIEEQVEIRPHTVAMVMARGQANDDEQLTYQELNRRANQLAHYLRRHGVGPETRVGIYLERSLEMAVGLLAVLKAGGAYLPLDARYPLERLEYMVGDAAAAIILTQEQLLERLPAGAAQLICLDVDWPLIGRESQCNPESGVEPTNAAYLIYTSGSTGRPKGVEIEHRGLPNMAAAQIRRLGVEADDRVLQFASLSFDASIFEIVMALGSGAKLCLGEAEQLMAGEGMIELLRRQGVTKATLPPSVWAALPAGELPQLKTVIAAGEACPAGVVEEWGQGRRMFNAYGPTEATVWASVKECRAGSEEAPSLGRPIDNTQIYLLDGRGEPVPVGVAGEIHLGGVGLARGYVNRGDLTAGSFLPHPFSQEPGQRLYRTGDRGRYLPSGEVEYLGRSDHQVKLRGFRIELGEIENVLSLHPEVNDAAVIAEDEIGGKRLSAYVVPKRSIALKSNGRKVHTLPNNMEICYLNQNEADFMYREIFEEQTYLKHGIMIGEGDCIFDVGANIGLFTLFIHQICPSARIYAIEPIPPIFEVLKANIEYYDIDAELFNYGLSDHSRDAAVTYYPKITGMSGLYADRGEDVKTTRAFLANQDQIFTEYADDLLKGKFENETYVCRLQTLSDIISEKGIEKIDLLKIDVEKSELDVLMGIDESDWKKIKQIVVEVHDSNGRLSEVQTLLQMRGYQVVSEQNESLRDTGLYNVYAVSSSTEDRAFKATRLLPPLPLSPPRDKTGLSAEQLQKFLSEKIPDHMIPSAFAFLRELPRTPNGKLDRKALPSIVQTTSTQDNRTISPRDVVEFQLLQIWGEILKAKKIGVKDNFFDLGGHSLIAVKLIAKIKQLFNQDLPLSILFQAPTIEQLAGILRQEEKSPFRSAFVPIQPNGSNPPLFLAHPAGGSLLCYLDLAQALMPDQPIYGFQSPGLFRDCGPLETVEETATHYLEELIKFKPRGPYMLGGISMGGILAYEMARQLYARGEQVSLLAMFDTTARDPLGRKERTGDNLGDDELPEMELVLPILAPYKNQLKHLKGDEKIVYIWEKLREKKLVPPDFDLTEIGRYIKVFKHNVKIGSRYVLPPYPGRITLFRASHQADQSMEDQVRGWTKLAAGGVVVYEIPATHMTILTRAKVESVAEHLRQCVVDILDETSF